MTALTQEPYRVMELKNDILHEKIYGMIKDNVAYISIEDLARNIGYTNRLEQIMMIPKKERISAKVPGYSSDDNKRHYWTTLAGTRYFLNNTPKYVENRIVRIWDLFTTYCFLDMNRIIDNGHFTEEEVLHGLLHTNFSNYWICDEIDCEEHDYTNNSDQSSSPVPSSRSINDTQVQQTLSTPNKLNTENTTYNKEETHSELCSESCDKSTLPPTGGIFEPLIPTLFHHEVFGDIRVILIGSEVWFVGKDVARALSYGDYLKSLKKYVSDEHKQYHEVITPGGRQKMIIINKAGINDLSFGPHAIAAECFKHWISSTLDPILRRMDSCVVPKMSTPILQCDSDLEDCLNRHFPNVDSICKQSLITTLTQLELKNQEINELKYFAAKKQAVINQITHFLQC